MVTFAELGENYFAVSEERWSLGRILRKAEYRQDFKKGGDSSVSVKNKQFLFILKLLIEGCSLKLIEAAYRISLLDQIYATNSFRVEDSFRTEDSFRHVDSFRARIHIASRIHFARTSI